MKKLKNLILIGSLTILLSLNLNATLSISTDGEPTKSKPGLTITNITDEAIENEFSFEDEEYINDIPFNIDHILEQYKTEKRLCKDFYFDEEEYIDDIPFNTKIVLDTLTTPSIVWYSDIY